MGILVRHKQQAGADPSAEPPKRADARRNRDRLVAVATALIAEQGVAIPLEAIARQAGVGIGTLYRHFPTREALIEAVYREEHAALLAAAESMGANLPGDQALARWMQRSLDYMATKRGLGDSLRQLFNARPELLAAAQSGFPQSVGRLLQAGIADGSLRPDIGLEDILYALAGIYSAPATPEWRERAGRVLELLMDGLRAGAPGRP